MLAVSKTLLLVCIIALIVLIIGLAGWIAVLKNDVGETTEDLESALISLKTLNDRMGDVESRLNVDLNSAIETLSTTFVDVGVLKYRLADVEKSLAVSDDQMKTIMGDHASFADVLEELGESSALPSGERRGYGGYGN